MRVNHSEFGFGQNRAFVGASSAKNKVSAKLFYLVFTILVATNIITILLLLFDSDISNLISKQNEKIYAAYEERVTQLRIEVDRLYSRQYAQTGNLNLQLIELTQQQAALAEIQPFVKTLAKKAQELGIADVQLTNEAQPPLTQNIETSSINSQDLNNQQQVKILSNSISQLSAQSHLALKALSQTANNSTNIIIKELKAIGVSPSLSNFDKSAVGGPFIRASNDDSGHVLINEANEVLNAFDNFKQAKETIKLSPVFMPLSGEYRLSSAYGKRKDPFGRQSAFHSGMDFAAPRGSIVSSAGAGIVSFSGRNGGYGISVEIKHANGLVTRYAHLSASLVKKGQSVNIGEPIAKVGSTGRSTGPHLHFEIRKAGNTLNPQNYINVGKKLAQFI